MPFSDLLDALQNRWKQGNKTLDDGYAVAQDRADSVLFPDKAGPAIPDESTPEEQKYYTDVANSVPAMASVGPIGAAEQDAGSVVKNLLAKSSPLDTTAAQQIGNVAVESGQQPLIQRATSNISRSVDLAARNQQQLQAARAARLAALKTMSGQ